MPNPTAFCLRCRRKIFVSYPCRIANRIQGVCPFCGSRVSTFVRKQTGGLLPPLRLPYPRYLDKRIY